MKNLFFLMLLLFLSTVHLISCSRVEEFKPGTKGNLKMVELKKLDAIPLKYGSVVGTTANQEYSDWGHLWFEDDDGTIRVVSVNFVHQIIHKNVTLISRN